MNHYDSNYAANLERDDEEEPILCENCEDAEAWNPLVDGRQVCIGCAFAILDEFIREQRDSLSPPAHGSIVETMDAAREAGGKAWDRVEDVDAELGRKPVVGPATKALAEAIQSQRTKVELAGGNYVLGGYDMHVKLSNDVVDAFFAELEADR
jgi:hypothetical protein